MSEVRFTGQVGRTLSETTYGYERVGHIPPTGAPNVVYVVLDDMGFASLGCYGNDVISTPNIDRLAAGGLRYNNFHTTAICSATRASLLTGANHHAVGVASVVDQGTGCDNGTGHIDPHYATTAEVLHEYDYSTFAVGKWHLSSALSDAGPFDNWPLGKGFDHFYGFLTARDDQFHPILVRDNSFVDQPKSAEDGYHFSEDITDQAIDYVFKQKNAFPERPFFLYLAFGAVHTPFHAPRAYIDRYRGKFDEGWDVLRERWFQNQKRLGVIPEEAELTERNELVSAWDSLDEGHKRLYARHMEVYAGFLEHTDTQIGRLLDYLESIGQLDNTIVVLLSDNGASSEGGTDGKFNGQDMGVDSEGEYRFASERLDQIGGELSFPHYPTGWANALNAPFSWYKLWAFEGGVHDDLIVSYPRRISDAGGIRSQFTHVSDVTPTVLEAIGISKPAFIKGVEQRPFTGTSFAYTFDDAQAPSRKHVQHFEVFGNRAIYKDGWKAVVNHTSGGWKRDAMAHGYEHDRWELYHVASDFSEKHDVAAEHPEKVRELAEAFLIEAARNGVFPMLDASGPHLAGAVRFGVVERPEKTLEFRNIFKPYRLAESNFIDLDRTSHYALFDITVHAGDHGVLIGSGNRFGGYALYVKDGRLHYGYNANSQGIFRVTSSEKLPEGDVEVGFRFERRTHDATVTLSIDGEDAGSVEVTRFYRWRGWPCVLRANPYTPILDDYEVPFEFTGDIRRARLHSSVSLADLEREWRESFNAD